MWDGRCCRRGAEEDQLQTLVFPAQRLGDSRERVQPPSAPKDETTGLNRGKQIKPVWNWETLSGSRFAF